MIITAAMLIPAAEQAGIKLPTDPFKYDKFKHPHWHILCMTHVGLECDQGAYWERAKKLALIPEAEVITLTVDELQERGIYVGPPPNAYKEG